MATAEEALMKKSGDIYRSILHDEADNTTKWRHGGPPTYDSVNQLFEQGRTKVPDPKLRLLYMLCACLCQDFFFSVKFLICVL